MDKYMKKWRQFKIHKNKYLIATHYKRKSGNLICYGKKKFLKTQNLCKKLTLHFDI